MGREPWFSAQPGFGFRRSWLVGAGFKAGRFRMTISPLVWPLFLFDKLGFPGGYELWRLQIWPLWFGWDVLPESANSQPEAHA